MTRLPPETKLVERIQALFATRRRDVVLGIGDDAAVVRAGDTIAISTDVLVEDEDFTKDADPRRLGRKALSVNLSDLAAMGAEPLHALLTLGLPRRTEPAFVEGFLQGFRSCAVEYGVAVVGGDLSASAVLFASVTVLGRPSRHGVMKRSGASPGDALYLSGTLGAAAAGLSLLRAGYRLGDDGRVRAPKGRRVPAPRSIDVARLIRHQVDPRPMVELGRTLAEGELASAAIDLSDGLARDLHRLCRASDTGATLEKEALPLDSALGGLERLVKIDPASAALYGGEDFGLLFAVPKRKCAAVERLAGRFALRRVGTVEPPGRVLLASGGRSAPLPDAGFDHFGAVA